MELVCGEAPTDVLGLKPANLKGEGVFANEDSTLLMIDRGCENNNHFV